MSNVCYSSEIRVYDNNLLLNKLSIYKDELKNLENEEYQSAIKLKNKLDELNSYIKNNSDLNNDGDKVIHELNQYGGYKKLEKKISDHQISLKNLEKKINKIILNEIENYVIEKEFDYVFEKSLLKDNGLVFMKKDNDITQALIQRVNSIYHK
jgi:hypothetical protein